MKIYFTSFFILLFLGAAHAQQPAQYSMYMWNKYAFNPAYAGMENSLSLTGVYRNQWTNLEGAPETQSINAHMPFYFGGGGVGIGLENETIGSWRQTTTMLTYNYQSEVSSSGVLSMGLSAGLVQRELDGSKVRTPGGVYDDNSIEHQDPSILEEIQNGSAPTFHAGIFYQSEKLEVGISAMNLLENEVSLTSFGFKPDRTYFLYGGYQLDLSKKLVATPSVLLKSSTEQTQIDLSVLMEYNENIFFGASFRGYDSNSRDAIALIGGFKLSEKATLGYSFDITTSNLRNASSGTHELLLNYNLGRAIGKGKPPHIIYNPRSL